MARFTSIPIVTGTFDQVCIYKRPCGTYFMRQRSSLTGDRVKKDPAFRETMRYAGLLAQASQIGSTIYAQVPVAIKRHSLYRSITGEAMTWLKYGWKASEVLDWLQRRYTGHQAIELYQPAEKAAPTEEELIIDFERRRNRRILRQLRKGDYSILDMPPD